jgi:hypothetical protein
MHLYVVKGRRMKMHFRSVSCIFARWKSTSATCGRRSVISFVASAVVAAGPVTLAPKSSRCCFRASATLWESSTRRISNPRRSSSDPLASGGPQSWEEDIASYSISRRRLARTSQIVCRQSAICRRWRACQVRLRRDSRNSMNSAQSQQPTATITIHVIARFQSIWPDCWTISVNDVGRCL